jgi:aryl-alcohol dehydrogenase-like predicted oxidoreductase
MGHAGKIGVTLLDTADMYGSGRNEELVARAIKKFGRDKFFISTKFGIVRDFEKRSGAWLGVRGDKEYIKQACNDSLKRLGIDQVCFRSSGFHWVANPIQSNPIQSNPDRLVPPAPR